MALAPQLLPNYTYLEYSKWEGDWELIEGIPFAMTPAPSIRHQRISMQLSFAFRDALDDLETCDCEVIGPIDLKVSDHTVVQPDISILCESAQDQYVEFPPSLVVEILSPSRREHDIITKRQLYEKFGIKYYLIADPNENKISALELHNAKYVEMESALRFTLDESCAIEPDFSKIF